MTELTQRLKAVLQRVLLHPLAKPLLIMALIYPGAWLIKKALGDELGVNPAEALIRQSGDLTLNALCYLLLLSPLRELSGVVALARFRRILGLGVFGCVCLHVLSYAWFDMDFEWVDIWADVLKRPFIFVGFAAFVILSALALTSFNSAIRTLGAKRWRMLHKGVFVVVALGLLHFYWMRASKHRFEDVINYAWILTVLVLYRLGSALRQRQKPKVKS
jgi:sulfoxide reductase heme-binding subunit YedZ